jgi:hypothetical protein
MKKKWTQLKELNITLAIDIAGRMDNIQFMDYVDELKRMEEDAPTDRKQIAIIEKLVKERIEGLRKRFWIGVDEIELTNKGRQYQYGLPLPSDNKAFFLDDDKFDELESNQGKKDSDAHNGVQPEVNSAVKDIDTRSEEERDADEYWEAHLFEEENHPELGEVIFASEVNERYTIVTGLNKIVGDEENAPEPVNVFKIGFTVELLYRRNDNKSWRAFYEKVKTMDTLSFEEQEAIIHKILTEDFDGGKITHLGFAEKEFDTFASKITLPAILTYRHITGSGRMNVMLGKFSSYFEKQKEELTVTCGSPENEPENTFDESTLGADITTLEEFCASENISLKQLTREKMHKDSIGTIVRLIDPTGFEN